MLKRRFSVIFDCENKSERKLVSEALVRGKNKSEQRKYEEDMERVSELRQ